VVTLRAELEFLRSELRQVFDQVIDELPVQRRAGTADLTGVSFKVNVGPNPVRYDGAVPKSSAVPQEVPASFARAARP
jgi:hypothetical protein